ncbi:uncharacterized protein LOC134278763 [Saccostrea cucullata]|uniref:uncharacterized protein LOC134278763 n=1 Tax=Saccostrea cuccullata TaxID=36930 RepID=UPI002ED5D0B4
MDIFKWLFLVILVIAVLHFIHSVQTYTLERKICVDIPMKFAGRKLACEFTLMQAEQFLQGGNCSYQSDVSISNLRSDSWPHKLSELILKYGHQERRISLKEFCPSDHFNFSRSNVLYTFRVVTLFVDCSHGNFDCTSALCNNNTDCGNNAECSLILSGGIGVCFCKSEHIRINGRCYNANVPTGGTCVSNIQCRDRTYSGVCLESICTCGEGNHEIENGCFAGK